jgi:hypothetical protein
MLKNFREFISMSLVIYSSNSIYFRINTNTCHYSSSTFIKKSITVNSIKERYFTRNIIIKLHFITITFISSNINSCLSAYSSYPFIKLDHIQ